MSAIDEAVKVANETPLGELMALAVGMVFAIEATKAEYGPNIEDAPDGLKEFLDHLTDAGDEYLEGLK